MRKPCVYLLAVILGSIAARGRAAEERTGEQLYRELCARCHGAKGEGVKSEYSKPLVGDRSVADLAQVIHDTMPEDAPEKCAGEDARKVAEYIHGAFYSRTAQARHQPPRIELARLTAQQYRQSVADLAATFIPARDAIKNAEGLRGEYFKSRRFGRGERVVERVDRQIDFQFGEGVAVPEQPDAKEFGMRWQGSVLAPDTGEYELVVESENAVRLWFNDDRKALIDAWVKSGSDTQFKAEMRLVGGRAYPVRLEYSKSKEPRASVRLLWKRPRHSLEPIPQRFLFPQTVAVSFVSNVPFPPDDRSQGYERGTSISKEWDQATTDGALEVAAWLEGRLDDLARAKPDAADRADRLREFAGRWSERALGRALTEDERTRFIDKQFAASAKPEEAVQRVVLLTLKSSGFLYPDAAASESPRLRAARLSRALWDSLPDAALLAAADASSLDTPEQLATQARRLLADPRARAKLDGFFRQWLRVDHWGDLAKDSKLFPEFDPATVSDLHTSLELALEETLTSERADFRDLLISESLHLNGRLAKLYGVELPSDAPFQKVSLPAGERAGLLTHPLLLTGFAYHSESSPIHRGVFVMRSLLGRFLRPPPEAVAPLAPDLHPNLTTRERVTLQTSPMACQACHSTINPLGFPLEQFDAIGRFRREQQGKPIDASGSYRNRRNERVQFQSARDLGVYLAANDETYAAFVEQLFQYLAKQPIQAYGPEVLPTLMGRFKERDFNVRELVAEMAVVIASPPVKN